MAKDAWGKEIWVPAEQPYRVSIVRNTNAVGCYGWRSDTKTYATIEQATEAMEAATGFRKVYIDIALNADTWRQNGWWKTIKTRYPVKKK